MFKIFSQPVFGPEDEQGASPKPMSIDEVAASLVVEAPKNTAPKAATREQEPKAVVTDASSNDAEGDADDNDSGDEGKASGSGQDAGGGADDEDFDPFASESQTRSNEQELDGPDAELHEVVVDGQKVEVTLAELKRRYSGETAIERRLQEATTKLTEANNLRSTVEQEVVAERSRLNAERNRLATALQALRGTIAAPMVKRPDPALARTDPNKYNAQLAAFNADQVRVQAMNQKVDEALQANTQQNVAEIQEQVQVESMKFIQAVPALRDPANIPKVMGLIHTTARAHGFSDAEVSGNRDHRLLLLALKAGRYDALMAQREKAKTPAKTQTSMRPGGGDAAGAMGATGRQNAAAQARQVKKAQETGRIDDVAATLIVPQPRRRRM